MRCLNSFTRGQSLDSSEDTDNNKTTFGVRDKFLDSSFVSWFNTPNEIYLYKAILYFW